MTEVVIKKSELLTMKYGLGKSNSEIAKHYGITEKEAVTAMKTLGLIKDRKGEEIGYVINLQNDVVDTTIRVEIPQVTEA
jgi:predicted transcriptional regulator